jgi:hypothetical protein
MELLDQSITFVRDRRRTAAAAWEGSAGQHPYIVASGPHASVPHDGGNRRAPERGSCPASAGGQAGRAVRFVHTPARARSGQMLGCVYHAPGPPDIGQPFRASTSRTICFYMCFPFTALFTPAR